MSENVLYEKLSIPYMFLEIKLEIYISYIVFIFFLCDAVSGKEKFGNEFK